MQPHAPYLGSKAEKLRDRVDLRGYNIFTRDESTELNRDGHNLWNAVKKGYISDREIREGYNQTLKIALDEVSELVDDLDGKSVITADHGEMLGERVLSVKKSYGHPSGIKTRELREIPWFVIPGNRRRKIVSETPLNSEQMNDDEVENRLQALGYKPDRRQDDPK